MYRALLAIALCAGCYGPALQAGSACDTECPGDLVCIDHVCREPGYVPDERDAAVPPIDAPDTYLDAPIDGPPGDGDADGIVDPSDNCPSKPNADQHDEDSDAVGDVCDPCPHLAGAATDSDGDGVGDACDPQPGVAKQRILFFDPFTSDRVEWDHGTGTSRVGETLRVLGAASAGSTRVFVANGALRIATGGTVAAVSSSTPHQLSINFGFNAARDDYHYVELYDSSGNGGGVSIAKANSGTYTELVESPYSGALPTGAWSMRIDESVATQQIALLATVGGVDHPLLMASTMTASPMLISAADITFYVRNADIRVDYFLVIETLP